MKQKTPKDHKIRKTKAPLRGLCFSWLKAQAAFEYAIILAIVVAALTGMQVYFKRGIQAGIKICSDELGSQKEGLVDEDIEQGIVSQASTQHISSSSVQRERITKGEARQVDINDVSTRTGTLVSTPYSLQPVRQSTVTVLVDPDSVVTIFGPTGGSPSPSWSSDTTPTEILPPSPPADDYYEPSPALPPSKPSWNDEFITEPDTDPTRPTDLTWY